MRYRDMDPFSGTVNAMVGGLQFIFWFAICAFLFQAFPILWVIPIGLVALRIVSRITR